jgi:hypothetical protein
MEMDMTMPPGKKAAVAWRIIMKEGMMKKPFLVKKVKAEMVAAMVLVMARRES